MTLRKAKKRVSLPVNDLRWKCDLNLLNFSSTKELEPSDEIIGQDRALRALRLGMEMKSPGYNIYISGLAGTGKATTVQKILEQITSFNSPLFDYIYVNNFKDEDRPLLLTLPAGEGKIFKNSLNSYVTVLKEKIPTLLDSDAFNEKKNKIIDEYNVNEQKMLEDFEKEINSKGFTLGQIKVEGALRPDLMPIINKKPVAIFQLDKLFKEEKLSEAEYEKIIKTYKEYQPEMMKLIKRAMALNQEVTNAVSNLEKNEIKNFIEFAESGIRELFTDKKVNDYLTSLSDDVISNLILFKGVTEPKNGFRIDPFRRYEANIILDNTETDKFPVVIETLPTSGNLFGSIEKIVDRKGGWYSDFMSIKAGTLLRASGGFLILNVHHLFEQPGVWKALKRILTYQKLDIQDNNNFILAPSSLKPESIDISTKIILMGDNYTHSLLSTYEDNFKKIFKVKADFDYEIQRDDAMLLEYAKVLKKTISAEGLPEFDKKAIGYILEYSARYVGRKDKLTSRFSVLADIIREAAYYATTEGCKKVKIEHTRSAVKEALERHNLQQSKLMNGIKEGHILIDSEGMKVGEINGLTVYSTELLSFGMACKITATVSLGSGMIVNVEREAGLAGTSFNKAMMIITGYIREMFGRKSQLSFNANIVFEQSYGGIDGDSASAAEICVLLSAISRIPINQGFAITGSVNQKGLIQPIGGVNEKIEGFYEICKIKGLTGKQGVVIPFQNINDLMLSEEVVEAVKKKSFHIFAVQHVKEALEILTGIEAGDIDAKGCFEEGTIFNKVVTELEILQNSSIPKIKRQDKNNKKS